MVVQCFIDNRDRTGVRISPAPLAPLNKQWYYKSMRIASVNFYVFNKQPHKDTARLRRLNLDIIGFQEAQNDLHNIREGLPEHRILWNRKVNTYGAREVAVAIRKDVRLLSATGREVSDLEPGEERKVFKSRWMTVVRFKRHGRKVAVINYHGNATIQDKRGYLLRNAERVREWLEASVIIQRRIKQLQRNGFDVFVTGDWNYRRKSAPLAYWSPQKIFTRCGLDWFEKGLDYIAWPKDWRRTGKQIIDAGVHGGDHDWIIIDVRPKG